MKILLIVKSKHNDNTLKIAEAMSEVSPTTVTELSNIGYYKLDEYDIIGFGSGIYFGKHDKELLKTVKSLCIKQRFTFIFSTSGSAKFEKNNATLKRVLELKDKIVLGSFGCKGHTKWFPLSLFGGINKHHPDMNDFEAAQQFIENIIQDYNRIK